MQRPWWLATAVIIVVALGGGSSMAQPPPSDTESPTPPDTETSEPDAAPRADRTIRPYDEVITADATSDPGIFTVHRVGDKVYYEIPAAELGTEFLWVSQIARTTLGVGHGGQALGSRVVRWDRRGDRVLLRNVSHRIHAAPDRPVARAVAAANHDAILRPFPIEALGPDDAPVIDVTPLFVTELTEFSARTRLGAQRFDGTRSFVDQALAFPRNIEVEATHTYTAPPASRTGSTGPRPARRGIRSGSASVVLHYSMVKLPEDPMQPRLYDERVGYFSVGQRDFGRDEHRAVERRYITRWRLEKRDPAAARSAPVAPIVFWIDAATPTKWVPYLEAGVESWQPAFEAAGFLNAIVARRAPTPEEDPEFSPEDARYSVIRWLPSTIENAMGPHVNDPRTGEILEADIQFHHNIMNLLRDWYFVQVAPLDPRARDLPLPDELMGTLLQYVTAHEVGHTLGFQHNMKASSLYPIENVRDPAWVAEMGHTPTLMDYARFNYVAQPEDGIPPADLIPGIGPYDVWATVWGYAPIPEAATPDDERPVLDTWAREQDDTAWYRFTTAGSRGADPGELTEAVGDADPVEATRLGLKNLERVATLLLTATTEPGRPYDDLGAVYRRLVGQWTTEMNHVAALVGGVASRQTHGGQAGVRFAPIARARQEEAMTFLATHAFETPSFLLDPSVLRRIEVTGTLRRIATAQGRVLDTLLRADRMTRLIEQQAIEGERAYAPTTFLADLRRAIWSELDDQAVSVDPYRRNLQRRHLSALRELAASGAVGDQRAFVRGELRELATVLPNAVARAGTRETALHFEDMIDQITHALDPDHYGAGAPGRRQNAAHAAESSDPWDDEVLHPSDPRLLLDCWQDGF